MRVAILGAGAIGAYVGAALHRGGTEVHLVARGPHLAAIRKRGVEVLSPRGDWVARTPATDDPAEIGPVDVVFLGLKANSYASCGPLIASTAAHWLICEAQESVLVIQRVKTGASAGLDVSPMRQPVIAQVFEAPSEMMVRSYIPGTCAMEKNSPW